MPLLLRKNSGRNNPDLMKSTRPRLVLFKSGDHWKTEPRDDIGRWATGGKSGKAGANGAAGGEGKPGAAPSPQTGGGMTIRQPVSSEYEVFDQAKKTLPEFQDALDRGKGVASLHGAETVNISDMGKDERGKAVEDAINGTGDKFIIAPLKSPERARAKAMTDYGGDWSRVKDVVRGTYLTDSPESARKLLGELHKKLDVVEVKDRMAKPTDAGYRDICALIKMPSGHIAEFQINVRSMLKAKEAAHHLYAEQQSIGRKVAEGGTPAPEDTERLKHLLEQQRSIYGAAWENAGVAKSFRPNRLILRMPLRITIRQDEPGQTLSAKAVELAPNRQRDPFDGVSG